MEQRDGSKKLLSYYFIKSKAAKIIRKEKTGEEEKVSHGLVPPSARLLASDWMQIRN